MPVNASSVFQESDHGLSVTIRTHSGNDRRAHVRLSGEIDMASCLVLSKTVNHLAALAPASVLMDLAEITFACSTLPNFVVRVRQALPDDSELILSRATPPTEWLLRLTEMATIATFRDEPTEPFAVLA